jgi:hypothetical protein
MEMSSCRWAWLSTMAIVAIVVAAASYFNPNIGFANGPGCDSWYFFGIYENYSNSSSIAPNAYQMFRYPALLPWIYLAPHLPTAAFHELKFWTYLLVTAGLFTYASIKLFGERIGSFTAILFSCSTLVVGAFSHDYVTGSGIVWETAAIAATLWGASRANQIPGAFTAGVFHALGIFTHVPVAMFMFAVPLLFFAVSTRPRHVASFIRFNAIGIIGIVAATLALCIYSWSIGKEFQFYLNELRGLMIAARPGFYPRQIPDNWQWFRLDTNVAFFFAAISASIVVLVRAIMARKVNTRIVFPAIAFLPAAIVCFAWEFAGHVVLEENVYAPWMYPLAFLACGAGLALAPRLSDPVMFGLTILTAIALCIVASKSSFGPTITFRFIIAELFVILCTLSIWRFSGALVALSLAALICVTYPTGYGARPWTSTKENDRQLYEQTSAARHFILSNYQGTPVFWVSGSPPVGESLDLLPSITTPRTFLECGNFAASFPFVDRTKDGWNQWFPDLKAKASSGAIKAGQRVLIIASGQDLAKAAKAALSSIDLVGQPAGEVLLGNGMSIAAVDLDGSR